MEPAQLPPPRTTTALLLVTAGAVPGALLRWWLADLQAANLLGSLLIGGIAAAAGRCPRLFLFVGVGFCGALTSFSTWILDLDRALRTGAAAGVLAAVPAGLAAAAAGLAIGRLARLLLRRVRGPRLRR